MPRCNKRAFVFLGHIYIFDVISQKVVKQLLVIRHAKSDQSFWGNDFERPLNDRGHRDAPVMAERLLQKEISIDLFVASPAKRAKTTAEYFCKIYKRPVDDILFVSALYHAPASVFYQVINGLADEANTVAVFSHNPGITEFVNMPTNARLDNMPTCGIFGVKAVCNHWTDFTKAPKDFWVFDYPKNG